MKVITLTPEAFEGHCALLAEKIETFHPTPFDFIVGIKTGGEYVCDSLLHTNKLSFDNRYDVTIQRPSTKMKSNVLTKFLRILPIWVLDALRIAESKFQRRRQSDFELPENLAILLRSKSEPDVLIIDDAVDSGVTLNQVCNALQNTNSKVKITTAAITITTTTPIIKPDVAIYDNHTLIRFPWSKDYKLR